MALPIRFEALPSMLIFTRTSQGQAPSRRPMRARSNTAQSHQERYEPLQEELLNATDSRPTLRASRTTSAHTTGSPARDPYAANNGYHRPTPSRTSTFEGPTQLRQEQAPAASQWIQRATSENLTGRSSSTQLGVGRGSGDPYADPEEVSSYGRSSPERSMYGRSISPATSHGSVISRQASATALNSNGLNKKAPPPPPPSRAKKPPPPPPPMKRTLLAATDA